MKRKTFRINLINFELCSYLNTQAIISKWWRSLWSSALTTADRMTPLSRDDFATVSDPVCLKKKSQSKYCERDCQGGFTAYHFPRYSN